MTSVKKLQQEIEFIKQRNQRVEADKAWETSWTRKIIVAVLTYFVVVIFFYFAGAAQPFLNAFVPMVGFLFSTVTLSFVKRRWLQKKQL